MALLFKAGGGRQKVTPANGKKFTLEELQGFVDGFIERVDLLNGMAMYVNEDGKALGLPYNASATTILRERGCLPGDCVVGNAVCVNYDEEE